MNDKKHDSKKKTKVSLIHISMKAGENTFVQNTIHRFNIRIGTVCKGSGIFSFSDRNNVTVKTKKLLPSEKHLEAKVRLSVILTLLFQIVTLGLPP